MKDVQSVFVQMVNKPERKVIIKRGIKAEEYLDYCRDELRAVKKRGVSNE